MIEQVCAHIHNYFTRKNDRALPRAEGTFTVENGTIAVDFLQPSNYFLVRGSDFNDGVHQYPDTDMVDETFDGAIYKMSPDRAFIDIVGEIEAWEDKYGEIANSPYQSEDTIGIYSYQLKSAGKTIGESLTGWQNSFGNRLNQWRKLSLWL